MPFGLCYVGGRPQAPPESSAAEGALLADATLRGVGLLSQLHDGREEAG